MTTPKPSDVERAIFTPDFSATLTRGERNNNPGNIVKSDIFWQGEITGADGRFETFQKPEYGIRAIARVVKNYAAKYGLNTVRGIINRYAPPVENNTNAYVAAVANELGVSPDTPLNLSDFNTLLALVTAIIRHENGRVAYSPSFLTYAVSLAA